MKIIVIEDEFKLAELLRTYLQASGYEVLCIDNGLNAVETVSDWQPDLILLDLMLPGKDGLAICREIRSKSQIPIIMMTAKTEEIDRLLGLELGADDYICKPYSPREVVARVKAVLRRSATNENNQANNENAALQINNKNYEAVLDGIRLDLTPIEFRLLTLLASQPGRIFSRDQVLDGIYEDHRIVTDRAVDSHIKNLRKKLSNIRPEQEIIRSIYGVGYAFDSP